MEMHFKDNGMVEIDDARIVFRNFSGTGSKYNREGDRRFSVVIPTQEMCDALLEDKNENGVGWNVRIKPPRDEDDEPFMTLEIKVKFNGRGPAIYLQSGSRRVKLNEDTVDMLDTIDIAKVDMDIRPYDGMANGKPFRSAYLQSILVTQGFVDRFADGYED